MIKFFRKIRQRLLTENKFSKYLLYAIGEIILVVIGILIALSLNNWKEELANQGEESRILDGLKKEFEVNLGELERNIKLNLLTGESIVTLIRHIRKDDAFTDSRYVDSLLNAVYMFGSFDAETGLINEVISSGKLSIIREIELRDRITGISGLLDNLEEDYIIRNDFYYGHVIPYLSKYATLANLHQYMDFSGWSENYKSIEITESPFKSKYDEIDLLHFENLFAIHKLNNDFVSLNESALKLYLNETLEIINNSLEQGH